MNIIDAQRTTTLEITLNSSQTKYFFGKQPIVEGKSLTNLFYKKTGNAPSGAVVAGNDCYISLVNENSERVIDNLTSDLLPNSLNGVLAFKPEKINWEKSEIIVGGAITPGQSLVFIAIYK